MAIETTHLFYLVEGLSASKQRTVRSPSPMKNTKDHFRGCLLGGAIGDALGWPVEFLRYQDILHRYGIEGITELTLNVKARLT